MTQIKIEVPANDHIALSAMAEALNRIATERAPQELGHLKDTSTWKKLDKTFAEHNENTPEGVVQGEPCVQPVDVELNRLDEEREAFEASDCVVTVNESDMDAEPVDPSRNLNTEQDDTLDADGLPWDKRIHSRGKTRLSDDTWRLARKPNDKTDEEWSTYVESVKSELKAVQDIPSETSVTTTVQLNEGVTTDDIVKTLTSEPTLDEQAVADLTPPVVDEPAVQLEGVTPNGDVAIEPPVTTVGAPVAPVTPPTSLTPPVVEPTVEPTVEAASGKPSVTTFQELMLYMTSDAKKRGADNDMIKATLLEVDPALTAIPLIATRAELIPKFVEALEAKLA